MGTEPHQMDVELIHSWSSPRSLSTCLMYSFAQRDDTEVLDEGLHAYWMKMMVEDWPFPDEVPTNMESDGEKIIKDAFFAPTTKKYRYCKNMATHKLPATNDLIKKGKHLILIRNPLDILISYNKIMPPSFLQIGLGNLASLYCELAEFGNPPPVIDASDIQRDPEGTLRGLCEDLDIPFQPAMLNWEAGPKAVDSISGPRWYTDAHRSTGFVPPKKYPMPFPSELHDLLEQCLPFYNFLKQQVKRSRTKTLTTPPKSLTSPDEYQNTKLLAWVDGDVFPLDTAKVSVLDFAAERRDSVMETVQVNKGNVFKLEEHLDRLFESAKALALSNALTREEVKDAVFATLIRNNMFDNGYARVSVSRGRKVVSEEGSSCKCILIVLPEWKRKLPKETRSITLAYAASILQNSPRDLEGNYIDTDSTVLTDKDGYVLNHRLNDTNTVFLFKDGRIVTPPEDDHYISPIHRITIIDLAVKAGLRLEEERILLSDLHKAEEVWVANSMGEFYQVGEVNGKQVGNGKEGAVFGKVRTSYERLVQESGATIPSYNQTAA